jgi:hypothetical protein
VAGGRANLRPAEVGNRLAVRHGCYSMLTLGKRAREIAGSLTEVVPVVSAADTAAIEVLSMTLAQLERAHAVLAVAQTTELEAITAKRALTRLERESLTRLSADARGWVNSSTRLLDQLGLTPTARARLGLDVVRGQDAVLRLNAYLDERYGEAAS